MNRAVHRRHIYSRLLGRPSKLLMFFIGLLMACVGILMEHWSVPWKYSEVAFGTAILLWVLLSAFRPEWSRGRYWLVLAAVLGAHLWGWLYLARSINRFGFALMFLLVVVELVVGATLIGKLIPEDEEGMTNYINRW